MESFDAIYSAVPRQEVAKHFKTDEAGLSRIEAFALAMEAACAKEIPRAMADQRSGGKFGQVPPRGPDSMSDTTPMAATSSTYFSGDPSDPKAMRLDTGSQVVMSRHPVPWLSVASKMVEAGIENPKTAARFVTLHENGHTLCKSAAEGAVNAWLKGGPEAAREWARTHPEEASMLNPELLAKDGPLSRPPSKNEAEFERQQKAVVSFLSSPQNSSFEEAAADSYALSRMSREMTPSSFRDFKAKIASVRMDADAEHSTGAAVAAVPDEPSPDVSDTQAASRAVAADQASVCSASPDLPERISPGRIEARRALRCGPAVSQSPGRAPSPA